MSKQSIVAFSVVMLLIVSFSYGYSSLPKKELEYGMKVVVSNDYGNMSDGDYGNASLLNGTDKSLISFFSLNYITMNNKGVLSGKNNYSFYATYLMNIELVIEIVTNSRNYSFEILLPLYSNNSWKFIIFDGDRMYHYKYLPLDSFYSIDIYVARYDVLSKD